MAIPGHSKKASFIDAMRAADVRSPPRAPRLAGRNIEEFRRNIGKFDKKAPQFAEQARATADTMEKVLAQKDPNKPLTPRPLFSVGKKPQVNPYLPVEMGPGKGNSASEQNGIRLDSPNPATAGHEMGHIVDAAHGIDFGRRGLAAIFSSSDSQLPSEFSATQRSFKALGKIDPEMAAATGTYVENSGQGGDASRAARAAARKRYGIDEASQRVTSLNTEGLYDKRQALEDRVDRHRRTLDAKLKEMRKEHDAQRPDFDDPGYDEKYTAWRAQGDTLPYAVYGDEAAEAMERFRKGSVPPEIMADMKKRRMVSNALSRRQHDRERLDEAGELLANPYLNRAVVPGGDAAKEREEIIHKMTNALESGVQPGAGHAARSFLTQQEALRDKDPRFLREEFMSRLKKLGLHDHPALQDAILRLHLDTSGTGG